MMEAQTDVLPAGYSARTHSLKAKSTKTLGKLEKTYTTCLS